MCTKQTGRTKLKKEKIQKQENRVQINNENKVSVPRIFHLTLPLLHCCFLHMIYDCFIYSDTLMCVVLFGVVMAVTFKLCCEQGGQKSSCYI